MRACSIAAPPTPSCTISISYTKASPVALNVSGAIPDTSASTLFVPSAGPNVQAPAAAIPASSETAADPVIVPPPLVTLNTTDTPGTGLSN